MRIDKPSGSTRGQQDIAKQCLPTARSSWCCLAREQVLIISLGASFKKQQCQCAENQPGQPDQHHLTQVPLGGSHGGAEDCARGRRELQSLEICPQVALCLIRFLSLSFLFLFFLPFLLPLFLFTSFIYSPSITFSISFSSSLLPSLAFILLSESHRVFCKAYEPVYQTTAMTTDKQQL